MVQIIKVDFHLVGPDDVVVIGFWIGLLGQYSSVVALQLVGIARHIGARSDEAHLPDQNIN